MPSQRVHFENSSNDRLSGILDLPELAPTSFAIFSHCFTCTKDLKAIVRVSRNLSKYGIGVLRFDFAGLGDSQGDFSQSNFESNLDDIQAAQAWLASEFSPPQLVIGHSLGGAAMMASVGSGFMPSVKAIATLAAPSCTKHLAGFLAKANPEIEELGVGQVTIGGRTHTMRKQLLESFAEYELTEVIKRITIPHLILHSPADETLGFQHAESILEHTGGAKALVTLPDSDHLMVKNPDDVGYVADLIAIWSRRFLV